jgi:two-component sensor histidine kinase
VGTVSIVSLVSDVAKSRKAAHEEFETEVAARFGLVPNFFRSAPDAPDVVYELWRFAKCAYLDTPIPTLFKERLFVYLSRFCEARYCITRHTGFLLGLGRSAGDPAAPAMTIDQVIRLLRRAVPTEEQAGRALGRLEALSEPIDWPPPETSNDDDLLTSCTLVFLQPARADRAKRALRGALGGKKFGLLIGFLTFVRSAHYWTSVHPELALEDDVRALLREHEELARLLSDDAEAGRCEMGARLFEELGSLRDLSERQELERSKRALEESGRQKDLLIKEVDHRIKNSLQIVSGLLYLQAKTAGAAAEQFRRAAARVAAVAAIHRQLHKFDGAGTVELDGYLTNLCEELATASSDSETTRPIIIDADPLVISTDIAVPLALIMNELVTNAIKHSGAVETGGRVHIMLKNSTENFSVTVLDPGDGPDVEQTTGLGARIVEALARQIVAAVTKGRLATGYAVTIIVPHRVKMLAN